jgi:hypothetical protein
MRTETKLLVLDELLYDGAHRNALDTQYFIALHSRGPVLPCLGLG